MSEFCDACLLILPDEYFTLRSYQLPNEIWCSVCLAREQRHLPPRVPWFGGAGKPAGANANWVADNCHLKDKRAFTILLLIAGYLDNQTNDITVRELYYRCQRKHSMLRILQLIHKLERERYLIVHWATEPALTNTYELNTERRPILNYDPNEHTLSPKRKAPHEKPPQN